MFYRTENIVAHFSAVLMEPRRYIYNNNAAFRMCVSMSNGRALQVLLLLRAFTITTTTSSEAAAAAAAVDGPEDLPLFVSVNSSGCLPRRAVKAHRHTAAPHAEHSVWDVTVYRYRVAGGNELILLVRACVIVVVVYSLGDKINNVLSIFDGRN